MRVGGGFRVLLGVLCGSRLSGDGHGCDCGCLGHGGPGGRLGGCLRRRVVVEVEFRLRTVGGLGAFVGGDLVVVGRRFGGAIGVAAAAAASTAASATEIGRAHV